jgi:hypothetical protein
VKRRWTIPLPENADPQAILRLLSLHFDRQWDARINELTEGALYVAKPQVVRLGREHISARRFHFFPLRFLIPTESWTFSSVHIHSIDHVLQVEINRPDMLPWVLLLSMVSLALLFTCGLTWMSIAPIAAMLSCMYLVPLVDMMITTQPIKAQINQLVASVVGTDTSS